MSLNRRKVQPSVPIEKAVAAEAAAAAAAAAAAGESRRDKLPT